MTSSTITLNDIAVQSALAKLSQAITNKQPVLDAIGADVLKRVQMNFRNSQSPDGVAWAKLKKRQGQPLLDTGRLRNSINYQTNGDSVSIGTNVIYAKVHQFGHTFNHAARTKEVFFKQHSDGTIGNKFVKASKSNFAQKVKVGAHSITIPARPYLPTEGLPPAWQNAVVRIIQNHLQAAID